MDITWIAIAASLLMGGGALLVFIWAVHSHQFKSFEDVKYQVFWSDDGHGYTHQETRYKEQQDGGSTKSE